MFIHDVKPGDTTGDGGSKTMYRGNGLALFDTYVDATRRAQELGLVPDGAVERVAQAAESELLSMDFVGTPSSSSSRPNAVKRRQNQKKLERKATACRTLARDMEHAGLRVSKELREVE